MSILFEPVKIIVCYALHVHHYGCNILQVSRRLRFEGIKTEQEAKTRQMMSQPELRSPVVDDQDVLSSQFPISNVLPKLVL